jgi:hypothetical protein
MNIVLTQKLVHYTEGGPYFENYKKCDYANEWFEYI